MATKSSSKKNVKSLSNKLASVSKEAKSLGINTSKADAMVAQTKSQGSKAFAGSSYEKDYEAGKYGAIPMNAMQNTPVANIPPKPVPSDIGAPQLIGENVQNNQYVFDPKKSEAENAVAESNAKDLSAFNMIQKFIGTPEDKEPILVQAEKDAKIRQKEQAVNNYQSELNSIVAKQQQDLLQLRGTGSQQGVTEAVYGGQQATINREAAIRALPVQAALSAAQGNLELAQKQVERLFALKSEDIDRQYKYRTDMANAVLNIANESQKRILNVKLSEIQDKKDAEKQKLQFEQQLTLKNLTGGGSGSGASTAAYSNDLDAIVGTVLSTIPSKFGQQTFNEQIARARNDSDKLNTVAAQVLQGQPAEFKNDFRNQAVGIAQLDKAIALLDEGVQTGVLQNAAQYTYNLAGRDFDPKIAQINNLITSAIQPYRTSVTGAAWGEQEDAEYQQLFGSTRYSPAELRQRLAQTKELLKSKSSEGLNSFVNPLGTYDNPFKTALLEPTPVTSPTTTETPITRGFWGNIGNFLWGND